VKRTTRGTGAQCGAG